MCLLEVLYFLEVDMNYLQTRLCELKNSERGSCISILVDNTHIRSSFYTVYSQPDISDVSSSHKRSLRLVSDSWRRLKFKLVYSPLFFPAWLRMAIAAVI